MIIKEIKFKNYRIFQEQTFSFSDRVTVIAGVNGRGKSSLLDGIALMLSRLLPKISPAKGGRLFLKESDITIQQDELQLTATLNLAGYPISFSGQFIRDESPSFDRILPQVAQEIKNRYGYSDMTLGNPPIAVFYTTDRSGYRLPRKLSYPRVDFPCGMEFAYAGALRKRVVDYKDFMTRFRNMVTLSEENKIEMLGSEAPENLNGQKLELHNLYYLGDKAIEATQKAITEFLPGFHDLQVIEDPLRLIVHKGEDILDLTQLSDGERSIIAILIDLCKRLALVNPNLSNPLEGKGIIMIDEIELHLHPKWQREIIDKFRKTFPNIQFILTTHSPFVISTLKEGELRVIDESDNELLIETPGEYTNRGIEEVAHKIMDIDNPMLIPRYLEMLDTAKEYFRQLEIAKDIESEKLESLKIKLNKLIEPFPDDPAYRAFLEVQRISTFGE